MTAKDNLKEGIKTLSNEMKEFDGSPGKTAEDANEYYATQLSELIDTHAKSLIANLGPDDIVRLGLVAPPTGGPVTATTPIELAINDSITG